MQLSCPYVPEDHCDQCRIVLGATAKLLAASKRQKNVAETTKKGCCIERFANALSCVFDASQPRFLFAMVERRVLCGFETPAQPVNRTGTGGGLGCFIVPVWVAVR